MHMKKVICQIDKLYNLEDKTGYEVRDKLYELMRDRIVFLIGNVHGQGEVLLEAMKEWQSLVVRQHTDYEHVEIN